MSFAACRGRAPPRPAMVRGSTSSSAAGRHAHPNPPCSRWRTRRRRSQSGLLFSPPRRRIEFEEGGSGEESGEAGPAHPPAVAPSRRCIAWRRALHDETAHGRNGDGLKLTCSRISYGLFRRDVGFWAGSKACLEAFGPRRKGSSVNFRFVSSLSL